MMLFNGQLKAEYRTSDFVFHLTGRLRISVLFKIERQLGRGFGQKREIWLSSPKGQISP